MMRTTLVMAATCCLLTPVHASDEKHLLRTFKGHTKEVTDVAFSPDGKCLASSSRDASVRIWDTATGKELQTLKKAHGFMAQCVAFSPDGKWLATGGWDATVRLWDPATGRKVRDLEASGYEDDIVYSVAFSPDSKKVIAVGQLVAAGFDEPILIWDVAGGNLERKLDSKITNGLFSVAFNPDRRVFATASYHSGIRVWNAATGRVVRALRWDKDATMDAVSQIVFSRDGKMLASAGDDRMIRLWDVETGKELRKLEGHSGAQGKGIARGQSVTSVAFSPDGKMLASAAAFENTVRLWDVAKGQQLRTIKAHTGTVTRVVFHPGGKTLATASEDHAVKLWDVSGVIPAKKGAGIQ